MHASPSRPHPSSAGKHDAPSPRPAMLSSGQTLNRPLYHPVSGHTLLPAGAVLTDQLLGRIRRLGLEAEATSCVNAPPHPKPAGSASPDSGVESPAKPRARLQKSESDLEQAFSRGLQNLLTASTSGENALDPVMALIKTMIARLRGLAFEDVPALRIYGGGDAAHPINVTLFSLLIGLAMELSDERLFSLGQAALLHDIGKYRLDPRLVNKVDPLTSVERRVLERHVEFGVDTLVGLRARSLGLVPDVIMAIQHHHERWDGSGYPHGVKKRKIPLAARILAVADVYETMTTDRPYRTRRLPGDAYREILRLSGEAFDPEVVAAFRRVVIPYPNQTLVQLDTGAIAQVIQQGKTPEHPVVKVQPEGERIALSEPGSPKISKLLVQRLHPRVAIELPAAIVLPQSQELHHGRLADVSLGGANVVVKRTLAAGTPIALLIETAENEAVHLPAVVASCSAGTADPVRLGVRFLPLSPKAKHELESLLNRPHPGSAART